MVSLGRFLPLDFRDVKGQLCQKAAGRIQMCCHDLKFLADYFSYPLQDVVGWYYVRLILAACWQAEDGLDASRFLTLAQSILPMIEP